MGQISDVTTPGGTSVRLAMKIAVVAGRVRRFVVGDPTVQLIERTGRGHHGQAGGGRAPGPQRRGRGICARLADRLTTSELRGDSPDRVAVVVRLSQSRLHHWETKALTCTASWVLRWLTRTMRPKPAPLLSSSSASMAAPLPSEYRSGWRAAGSGAALAGTGTDGRFAASVTPPTWPLGPIWSTGAAGFALCGIVGSLLCAGNTPPPADNAEPNSASVATGQCEALATSPSTWFAPELIAGPRSWLGRAGN